MGKFLIDRGTGSSGCSGIGNVYGMDNGRWIMICLFGPRLKIFRAVFVGIEKIYYGRCKEKRFCFSPIWKALSWKKLLWFCWQFLSPEGTFALPIFPQSDVSCNRCTSSRKFLAANAGSADIDSVRPLFIAMRVRHQSSGNK